MFSSYGSSALYHTRAKWVQLSRLRSTHRQTNETDLILCRLERSGFRLVNFWASFQTVTMKKKALRMMMKHTGPKKLQMRPSFRDSQQLVGKKGTMWERPVLLYTSGDDACCQAYCCSVPYPVGLMMADIMTITRGIP